jgi:ABC-2 type transport system ATP-binding protein
MNEIKKIKKSNRNEPKDSEDTLKNSISKCEEILKKIPNDYDALFLKAKNLYDLSYFDSKYVDQSFSCFDKILRNNKENIEVLRFKANLLLDVKKFDEASNCFEEILKIQPANANAWRGKGISIINQGKPYLAINLFDKSLELDASDAHTWMCKAFALSARGETWDESIEYFSKALELDSNDSRIWKARGSVYQKKNLLDNAIYDFNQALRLVSNDWETLMLKGFALTGKHDFENAIKYFNKSLSIKQNNIETLNGKGDALFYMNNFKEAISIFEIINKLDEKYVNAWLQKGHCYLKLKEESLAKQNFEMVLKIDPNDIRTQKEIKILQFKSTNVDHVEDLSKQKFAIYAHEISKSFKINHEKTDSVFSLISNTFLKNLETIKILENISFTLNKGEMLGVIGENGSGKSTLLKILSGILKPDKGEVYVNGTIAPLLQLGTGFNGELTAKENIILAGMFLGFSKSEMKMKVDDIIKFADLEKFLDTKIKNFSSGMHARLAFSTAIQIDPDILLVDEVLAVGDINFVKKSYREFLSFREKGKSIILVSHSLEHIKNLCDRAMILEGGKIKMIGDAKQIVEYYIQSNN